MTGSLETVPAFTTPGQRMIRGTRIPPSYGKPLPERSGALCVGPSRPPLSEVNTTIVLPALSVASSAAMTLPTASSTLWIIAAYFAFFWLVLGFSR